MNWIAVAVGGLLGTGLRLGVDALLPHDDMEFPWSTLAVNVVGAYLLGALVARVWPFAPEWLRAGLGAGVLGSFTTFSAVAVSVVALVDAGDPLTAFGYLGATVAAGLAAAWAGIATVGHIAGTETDAQLDGDA